MKSLIFCDAQKTNLQFKYYQRSGESFRNVNLKILYVEKNFSPQAISPVKYKFTIFLGNTEVFGCTLLRASVQLSDL